MRRFDSGPRLQNLLLGQERVARFGRATVSESVSETGWGRATPPGFTDTPLKLARYRYAWAERAKTAGYPERFAQEALGHASKAVRRAYAKKVQVIIPPLEDYEESMVPGTVVPMAVPASA
jgi:integrase